MSISSAVAVQSKAIHKLISDNLGISPAHNVCSAVSCVCVAHFLIWSQNFKDICFFAIICDPRIESKYHKKIINKAGRSGPLLSYILLYVTSCYISASMTFWLMDQLWGRRPSQGWGNNTFPWIFPEYFLNILSWIFLEKRGHYEYYLFLKLFP